MEAALLTKKPGVGTGSLESRVKLVNGNSSAKNEDWYNRRKSYGFEQVQAHEDSSSCILKSKKLVESSTDSGICRSSEIVSRTNNSLNENQHNLENGQDHKTNGWKEVTTGQVKKLASTYDSSVVGQGASCWPLKHTELKSTTITIPIVKNNNVVDLPWYDDSGGGEIKRHSIAVDESQYVRRVQPINDPKYRRTSLVTNGSNNTADLFEDETNTTAGIRRTKKVEFCRTEVHFAAESGKVNIVATDEKPPPTQNFRRRRRNSGPLPADFGNKNGTMPVLRFGDSSEEQTMFGVAGDGSGIETGAQMSPRLRRSREAKVNQSASEDRKTFGVVTVNAGDVSCQNNMTTPVASERLTAADEDKKDPLSENEIKGILKNKPIKPKPYHLGEAPSPIPIVTYPSSDEETSSKWGVKLRHVEKSSTYNAKSSSRDSPPIWKSTVTVHNFYEKNSQEQVEDGTAVTPEFQKRLRNLRPTRKSECEYASDSDIKRSTLWNQEDSQGMEQKGCYSTKIHFGEGEATVLENDDRLEGNTTWPTLLKNLPNKDSAPQLTSHTVADNPPKSTVPVKVTHTKDGSSPTREQPSPTRKVQRNSWPAVRPDITLVEKLSSPSLVGKTEKEDVVGSHLNNDALKQSLRRIADNIVIRQPKKSEMTYFGVKVSPGPEKKVSQAVIKKEPKLSQKPGLLHHHKKSPSPTRCKFNKPRQESPEPIYENIHINNKYKGKEFDSSILDELTKAADQILQSVNGYTDEDSQSKQSTDEEKKKLETIDEARSLKPTTYSTEQKIPSNQKYKLRHTSSTSSVESVTKKKEANEKMTTTAERQAALQQQKKKQEKSDSSTSSKAHLKARRLQRASSREALLHSHGSSSEDLPNRIEVAIRKPRLVRKTKSVQLSMTNGLELKKPNTAGDSPAITKLKEDRCINKADERILNSLPEVRHKTAVSTIRSTSEKMSKDKAKYKHEDMKKKTPSKRDTNRGTISATPTMNSTTNSKPTALQSGAAPTSSKSLTPVKVKTVGVTAAKSDRQRYHQSQQQSNSTTATAASAAITQHRISTANIKKCVNGRPTTMVTNLKT
ncbi:unnamed protein product [Acanthoscelides obtectus]|nr:unnamed protein product [Acanthoscelides obtectus]CAK1647973.1 hypothetical protein AOBTE_LOCUS15483 [Acanthoscelides obtectus]